jgi:hypothetical protein
MTDQDVFGIIGRSADVLIKLIEQAQLQIDREYATIRKLREQLGQTDFLAIALGGVLDDDTLVNQAMSILLENASKALVNTEEFNDSLYIGDLLSACSNEEIFKIFVVNGEVKVEIDLDKSAGTIEEYGIAVKAARAQIVSERETRNPMGGKNQPPQWLSDRKWMEHIYSVDRRNGKATRRKWNYEAKEYEIIDVTEQYKGKYYETVNLRKSFFVTGHSAPWWYILEHGNANIGTVIGEGTPGPEVEATNFVANSQRDMKDLLDRKIRDKKNELREDMNRAIDDRYAEIEILQAKIEDLRDELANIADTPQGPTRFETASQELQNYLAEKGMEHLTWDARFDDAVKDIISDSPRMRNGFTFASGERHRLGTVYTRVRTSLGLE